ncbi:hypothetical protein SAMN05216404_11089 [Nitrosospira multiformis]|uniref:LysM domain-containing protein n=1 Tax=Nitrosospira multiformis TaxID=1231 RepID=A0A1H8LGP0_9PROT|nr:hypothetical protein [Nitrosospira multiformis]SEO03946.1 hypothetical protein SAMN05216404_11089 [Nitrosospira multiformis]
MIFPGSRYEKTGTMVLIRFDGTRINVLRTPIPRPAFVRGYFRRSEGQRLDLIANRFLNDPNGFWRLCDANNVMVPDALAKRDLVGIPLAGL